MGGGGEEGGAAPQTGFLAFLGGEGKNQICNLVFWPNSKFEIGGGGEEGRRGGREGGRPKFKFSAKNQAPPPPLQIGFWPFRGLGQGWQNPKIKFVIWFFGLFPSPPAP